MPAALHIKIKEMIHRVYPDDLADSQVTDAFKDSALTRFAVYVGLPHRPVANDPQQSQTWLNLAKAFIGADANDGWGFRLFRALFVMPINVVVIPFRIVLNAIKAVTTLLPGLSALLYFALFRWPWRIVLEKMTDDWCKNYPENAVSYEKPRPWLLQKTLYVTRLLSQLLIATLMIPALVGYMVFFLGRCLTSPMRALRDAWTFGKKTNKFWAVIWVALTMICISLLYMIIFPLAIHLMSTSIIPFIMNYFPSTLGALLHTLSNTLLPFFTTFGQFVLNITAKWLVPVMNTILGQGISSAIAAFIAGMPVEAGIGVILGIALGILPVVRDLSLFAIDELIKGIAKFCFWLFSMRHTPPSSPASPASELADTAEPEVQALHTSNFVTSAANSPTLPPPSEFVDDNIPQQDIQTGSTPAVVLAQEPLPVVHVTDTVLASDSANHSPIYLSVSSSEYATPVGQLSGSSVRFFVPITLTKPEDNFEADVDQSMDFNQSSFIYF